MAYQDQDKRRKTTTLYYQTHPEYRERQREYAKKWREDNKEYTKEYHRRARLAKYDLTPEEYEQMVIDQGETRQAVR